MGSSTSQDRERQFGEDGAVAVTVAILLVVFIGVAALAIDLGSAWSTKRDLVPDLDAAALAAARVLGEQGSSRCAGQPGATEAAVANEAERVLKANGGLADVDLGGQGLDIDCSRMTVRVRGSQSAQATFSSAMGNEDLRAGGYSVARTGDGANVLPMTFCEKGEPLASWIADGATPGITHRIDIIGPGEDCGDVPGNWGWFGDNSANGLRPYVEHGYPGHISLSPNPECTGPASSGDNPGWCNGGPGAMPSLLEHNNHASIEGHVCTQADISECRVHTFFIHRGTDGKGSGADYEPIAFLDAVITDVHAQGNNNSWIELYLVALRDEPGDTAFDLSSLCSGDGAPIGDPGCAP